MAETNNLPAPEPVQKSPLQCAIPELCVVMLIGPSGSGKTTFARKHFASSEILSSDHFREMVADSEADQTATKDAFEMLYAVAEKRLRRGKLVVIDATNVQPFAVEHIMRMAREHYTRVVAFAFGLPLAECLLNNAVRERKVPEEIIRRHVGQYRQIMRNLRRYKIRNVWTFNSNTEATNADVRRVRSRHYKHFEDEGPFDVIGDVHGCHEELIELLQKLGYSCTNHFSGNPEEWFDYRHPEGRKAVFVGDYVDRGPGARIVLTIVQIMERIGSAFCLPGNHDVRLARKLRKGTPGELLKTPAKLTHGLQTTLESLHQSWTAKADWGTPESREDIRLWGEQQRQKLIDWIEDLPSHLILDHGKLVVSHAGLREEMIGRSHGMVREFCLYSNPTGAVDDEGFPIREDWVKDYRGKAVIAYGHIHAGVAEFRNNTICLDTNVYMGGTLTALRYPEREIVFVPAKKVYIQPPTPLIVVETDPPLTEWANRTSARNLRTSTPPVQGLAGDLGALLSTPLTGERIDALLDEGHKDKAAFDKATPTHGGFASVSTVLPEAGSTPQKLLVPVDESLIDIANLVEKRSVDTRLIGPVRFQRDEAAAALEQVGRFGVDPRWLIYLPPTMSPCESAPEGDLLERPEEAFAYYRDRKVPWVVCEEKHMGSRLIAVVCRDEKTAFERFGVRSSTGACYTRLGRPFFPKRELETGVLDGVRTAMDRAGLWDKLKTNWICLDCELMPWSAKAGGLLHRLYAGTGHAGRMALQAEVHELEEASLRWTDFPDSPIQEADRSKIKEMACRWHAREDAVDQYVEAYRRYCWSTDGMKGLKLAPFHIMATEGRVHADKTNLWHMAVGHALAAGSDLLTSTPFRLVNLSEEELHGVRVLPRLICQDDLRIDQTALEIAGNFQCSPGEERDLHDFFSGWKIDTGTRWWQLPAREAAEWWHKMTTRNLDIPRRAAVADVEGMVVKPLDFTPPVDERYGRVQPALKCRGREYLRIIYGPEYTTQLEKLRARGLGSKRRLALQEFALGVEGLERFVKRQPLARIHECAFAVLALECEPLDPRL